MKHITLEAIRQWTEQKTGKPQMLVKTSQYQGNYIVTDETREVLNGYIILEARTNIQHICFTYDWGLYVNGKQSPCSWIFWKDDYMELNNTPFVFLNALSNELFFNELGNGSELLSEQEIKEIQQLDITQKRTGAWDWIQQYLELNIKLLNSSEEQRLKFYDEQVTIQILGQTLKFDFEAVMYNEVLGIIERYLEEQFDYKITEDEVVRKVINFWCSNNK